MDKTENEKGWFPCALEDNEKKEFEVPEYWDCDRCVLRLSWKKDDFDDYTQVTIYYPDAIKNSLIQAEMRFRKQGETEIVPGEMQEDISITIAEEECTNELITDKSFNHIFIGIFSVVLTISILVCIFISRRRKTPIKDPHAGDKYLLIDEENKVGDGRDVKVEKEENIMDQSKKKEIIEDSKFIQDEQFVQDKPLVEYKKLSRKQRKAAAAKAKSKKADNVPANELPEDLPSINEKPIKKEAKKPAKESQKQEVVQKAPEVIQESMLQPEAKVVPEAPIEEEKDSGTSASTPVKEGPPESKKNRLESPENKRELKGVKKIIGSNQDEVLKEFKVMKEIGGTVWRGTHFIFMLDCSTTMEGARWDSTVDGYIECVKRLNGMENVIISGFSFDSIRSPFCREKVPAKATIDKSSIPCTKKKRKYERALKYISQIIERSQYKDYLSCMIFISNGSGGYNETYSIDLLKLIGEGRKFVSYIIGAACNVDEDDLIKLTRDLKGEYYKVHEPETIRDALLSILDL